MSYPKSPETLVIKNMFYPAGLTELDVWNHYQRVKRDMLMEVRNRDVMVALMVDLNKHIFRRKGRGDSYIRLTPQNYDQAITGRTISLYPSMGQYEDFGLIDIDLHPGDGFNWAKEVTRNVYDFVMDKMPLVKTAQIRFTGKQSFHIKCSFARKHKIDSIRFLLRKFLQNSDLSNVYTIEAKRRGNIPNLDLAPNKFRGNFIGLHSLSLLGLRCMEVPYQSLMRFDPRQARIK